MAKRELLLGDEALALGALHAGLSGVYAYPGTPSTEITEYIQGHPLTAQRGIHCTWSANEKTAMEEALGMSFAGKRALVCMKHVGMNVAADAFVNSAMTGANGGLVVVAADDPSMHSSQNEQDSRFYGKFALVPTFEPSTQQEAYEMVQAAFDFSEKYRIPVLMRLTTRMAHSRAMVEPREARPENSLAYPARTRQWVLMPGNSRVRYEALLADYARFEEEAAASPFNRYADAEDKSLGIIACGIAYNYLAENYPDGCPHPVLKISQYPLPQELVRRMASECKALLIIEEGQPVVEEALRGILPAPVEIRGRMSGELPRTGELTPDSVRTALGLDPHPTVAEFVKSELAKVGVSVTINTITADEWYSKVYKEHDFQATLQEHVNTRDVVWYGNPTFYWGYNNEAVTALIDEAEQASTEDEQTEKLRAANEQIAVDAASAWLYLYPQIVVARSNVSGYGVNGLNSQFVVSGISKN